MGNYRDISNLINKHKGEIGFVAALGPSLKSHLEYIKSKKAITISTNDFDLMTDIEPNYWMMANSSPNSIPRMIQRINNLNSIDIIYADSVDPTPRNHVESIMNRDFYGYDQRHFDGKECGYCPQGCRNLISDRLTIQEHLQSYTKHNERYSPSDTVATHMLAMAILMGFSKIYIAGCDLDYTKGYVDGVTTNRDTFNPYLKNILNDFRIINDSANNIGTKIYNLSEISHLKDTLTTISNIL